MKGLKKGPLLGALAVCVLFALFGGVLVGEGLEGWYEKVSAKLLVPYYLWVLYDLAWTFELWRLDGGA